jgi:FlaG/FlaF family flagellin (archaellin)
MARGRTLASYHTDLYFLPAVVNIDVPNNLFAEASLGWTAATAGAPRRPVRFTPRHAVGVDATGRHHSVIVATTAADLWTGVSATWDFIDNFGATDTATVTGLIGEKGSV